MSFYKFNQISGKLSPTQQFKACVPQGLTPANKLKPASEVRANFPAMFRFRSTFNLVKKSDSLTAPIRSASTSLPTEFTATGFPKFPVGTKIGKNLVMGEYGPYSPKIRALQDLFQKDPSVPVNLKRGTSDLIMHRLMLFIIGFSIFVAGPFGLYTLAVNPEPYKRMAGIGKK